MSVDETERELRTDHADIVEKYLKPKDRLRKEIERCLSKRAHAQPKTATAEEKEFAWPEPKPIPAGLQPVDSFDLDFLPEALKPWAGDVSERLQCPPDYVGISAVVAVGSVIGRRMGIKPQQQTDWIEIPNVWGCFIGRPGTLKSPAMNEALRFVHRLEAEAEKENEIATLAYKANINEYKLKQQVKVSLEKARMKRADSDAKQFKIELDVGEEPKEPKPRRFCTNDSSYEALGELLKDNPAGILIERDELISLLKHLDREEQVVARGFYLSGWSGRQSYSFDRIGRGHIHLDAVCLSVLGGTQPARICEYIRSAHAGGVGGDGLIQRFGLMAWPDMPPDWRDVDRYPDQRARHTAQAVFDNAAKLDMSEALRRFADKDQFDSVPYLRFSPEAHVDFLGWHTDLERRLRGGDISAALEGHLAKYRKLVPALALINAVADGEQFDVSQGSLRRALDFAKYLETHARRVYGSATEGETAAAKTVLKRIRLGSIMDGFTVRDIQRHGWSHLTDREQIVAGLSLLCDLGHLVARHLRIGPEGGRPSTTYTINPRVLDEH
jgi:putative DNA primase/helicase